MITGWIIQLFSGFVQSVMSLMVFPEPPDFVEQLPTLISTASSYVAGTGVWIPWALLVGIIAVWAVVLVVAVIVKGVRILASFATLGGGSAA